MKFLFIRAIACLATLSMLLSACIPAVRPRQTPVSQPTSCSGPACAGVAGVPTLTAVPTEVAQPTSPLVSTAEVTRTPFNAPTAAPATPASPAPTQASANATAPACSGADCQKSTPSSASGVPVFSHVIIMVFENHEYGGVAGNTHEMPNFNRLAAQYTLLTQYYAISHPSLPNYLALLSGDTLGIHSDCVTCFVDAKNLPDLIEASGRTWKTYLEDMPSACFVGSGETYAQRHNPFVYFDDIRTNSERCQGSVLPLTQLDADLAGPGLPNFTFISPNLCNDAHDCGLDVADRWLGQMVDKLTSAKSFDDHSLIIVTFDEGSGDKSCCGLGPSAGGQVATLLISPLVKSGFNDATPYDHYSIVKTLAKSWGMPELGHAADPQTNPIVAPWK